jgi:hypothetical protein
MTDKEMALAIAHVFRRLQATETVYRTLVSRFRLDGEPISQDWIAQDVDEDLDPKTPAGQVLHLFALQLESTNPNEVLGVLYRELFEPK